MRDVQNLLATGYDQDYFQQWTKELGLSNLWEQAQP